MEFEYWRFRQWIGILYLVLSCCRAAGEKCPEAIFAFGASMSDTGNSQAAFPYESAPQSTLPYGETFFHRPANRWSDGRVVVDFLALSMPLLSPHLQSVGYDFRHGANFAFAGVTAQNNTYPSNISPPFTFWVQAKQFQYFKERTLNFWKSESGGVLRSSLKLSTKARYFRSGLYFITFGTNDFSVPLLSLGQTIEQVVSNQSSISNAIVKNVEEIYNQGGRTFMVFNVPPLGCYPAFLASSALQNTSTLDTLGCLATLNAAIESTNSFTKTGLQNLQVVHPDATIVYADLYGVMDTLLRNSSAYGFKETTRACCGAGGNKYNVNPRVRCGGSAVVNGQLLQGKSCSDPSSYVNWDGLHITDATAGVVARTLLQGKYLEPSYILTKLCNLTFEQY